MKTASRAPGGGPDTNKASLVPKSGDTMRDYSEKYKASSAMRNVVETHARQNAKDEEGKPKEGHLITPNRYRIVKSFLGTRDKI